MNKIKECRKRLKFNYFVSYEIMFECGGSITLVNPNIKYRKIRIIDLFLRNLVRVNKHINVG